MFNKNRQEHIREELELWREMSAGTVGKAPEKQTWTNLTDIINILNRIGEHKVSNYTFLPSGGGNELAGARASQEQGLVELFFDGSSRSATLVKPTSLTFHAVGDQPEWWYFRLETARFAPSDVYDHTDSTGELIPWSSNREVEWSMQYVGEELVEVAPTNYIDRSHWDMNFLGMDEDGYEIPLPKEARLIIRKFNGGAYVIFPKFSTYNLSGSFDPEHNKRSAEEFRQFIEIIVNRLKEKQ